MVGRCRISVLGSLIAGLALLPVIGLAVPVASAARPPELRVIAAEYGTRERIGDYVTLSVRNVGDHRSPRAAITLYESTDTAWSSDDRVVNRQVLRRISGHRQTRGIFPWVTEDTVAPFGSVSLFVCVKAQALARNCRVAKAAL